MKSSKLSACADRLAVAGRLGPALTITALMMCGLAATSARAQDATLLADQPVFTVPGVPGNLAMALSVEFPTVMRAAFSSVYDINKVYPGYFNPDKCYGYRVGSETGSDLSYFFPAGDAQTILGVPRLCVGAQLAASVLLPFPFTAVPIDLGSLAVGSGSFSGNLLNWLTTQTIDPFRKALTGGYRVIDTTTLTVLEKAFSSTQVGLFNGKNISLASATPFNLLGNLFVTVDGLENKITIEGANLCLLLAPLPCSPTPLTISLYVRVKVCDPVAGLESNCVRYSDNAGGNNWKPEGLMQKYSKQIRYSVLGYLNDNDSSPQRDGGVLRARQKFVGPTKPAGYPTPGSVANPVTEWDPVTGIFIKNPDTIDASYTNTDFTPLLAPVVDSGAINYINKFGSITHGTYKDGDPVSELYYATLRYLKNQNNVASYVDMSGATSSTQRSKWVDNFPVIKSWGSAPNSQDPILYACQRNFILGIGDIYTWRDKNLPGRTGAATGEPALPAEVSGDPTYTAAINAYTATDKAFALQGLPAPDRNSFNDTNPDPASGRFNSAGIVGLAYDANTRDIRSDMPGVQTVQTFWVDVLQAPFEPNNQFYLAAKYGGMKVPVTVPAFDPYAATTVASTIQNAWWHDGALTSDLIGGEPRPRNYFAAAEGDQMVAALTAAFTEIASQFDAFTTSFSVSIPQVSQSGNTSFSSQYDPVTWTGEVTASDLSFDANGAPTLGTPKWRFSQTLGTQLSGNGWDVNRRVITWDGSTGVPFRAATLNSTDLSQLNTTYGPPNDKVEYLNYLRGQTRNEVSSADPLSTVASRKYRDRTTLVRDIIGSKTRPVGPPDFPYSDNYNPGYAAFKSGAAATRPTVVYVASNGGMMHAINGATGTEMFAYVPRELFKGPTNPRAPGVDDLVSAGNPAFTHRNLLNATPAVYDIDFARTQGGSGSPNWRSVLIGGMGKGGHMYYAIDVTDPNAMAGSEATAASKVLWEFGAAQMGFTFGEPVVVKTEKYGWVVIFPSGYNNPNNKGNFFIVNPRNGALLETVAMTEGDNENPAGLAHADAFVVNSTDGTADALYAGDLRGNLWRVDLRGTPVSYSAFRMAILADNNELDLDHRQPVTSRVAIEVHPKTKKRFVMVGTGRLLDQTDIPSTQPQTFYMIADGTNGAFFTAPPTGASWSYPIRRSDLLANTDALVGVTINPVIHAGWREDLESVDGPAWRVITNPTTLLGSVAFPAIMPDGNVCAPAGNSRIYGRDFADATTTVQSAVGVPALFVALAGNVTELSYLSVAGKAALIAGLMGRPQQILIRPLGALLLRRLNWRELDTVN